MTRPAIARRIGGIVLAAALTVGAVPAARADLMQIFSQAGQFNDWLAISKRAGFQSAMTGTAPHTVFAAVDTAFASGKAKALLTSNDVPLLRKAILLQVVDGIHTVSDFMGKNTTLTTVGGSKIKIEDTGSSLQIVSDGPDGHVVATVVMQPIPTTNGIIYPVDKFF